MLHQGDFDVQSTYVGKMGTGGKHGSRYISSNREVADSYK